VEYTAALTDRRRPSLSALARAAELGRWAKPYLIGETPVKGDTGRPPSGVKTLSTELLLQSNTDAAKN
jgi:hypothetical protein